MLSLLSTQPQLCLSRLFLPQFSRVYVGLIKVDHINVESRRWPTATKDLLQMITASQQQDQAQSLQYYRFMIKTMLTLDEECVERAE